MWYAARQIPQMPGNIPSLYRIRQVRRNWTVPVFTLRSAVALAVLAVVAAGAVWLLVFLWGILARRRKARKAAAAQDETLDQSENKS